MIAEAAVIGVLLTGSATAYSPCEGSTSQTASGRTARVGYVANNGLAFGTWVEMKRPRTVLGRRWFQVMDRGGMAGRSDLDFWTEDCAWMESFGRRSVTYRVVSRRELFRGKPVGGWRVVAARHGGKLVWRPR